jgi:hypothetical protein
MLMRWLIALLLLTGVAFAQSQPTAKQAESPQQKSEQKTDGGQQNKQPPHSIYDVTTNWIVRAETIIAVQLQNASTYCAAESTKKEDKWLHDFVCEIKITDVVIAIFSVLLVGVTIGVVIVGYVQARRMRVTARQQLRAYVFVDNISIWNVTTPLTWEVASSYKPTGAEITHSSRGPFITMQIRNTGQTPAHYVVNWGHIVVREFPLVGKLVLPPAPFVTKNSIPAGGISIKTLSIEKLLTADEVADLKSNKKAIFVFGYIKYRDAFGKRRRTEYRFFYNGYSGGVGIATGITIHEEGNHSN